MKVLAVTGGIGSGKSFVTGMLSVMGCPVFDTDSRTKGLYTGSAALKESLVTILGAGVFAPDGSLDRAAMAGMIFHDRQLRTRVEEAVYPVLYDRLQAWLEESRSCGTEVAVVESALVLEKEMFRSLADKVLAVSAPERLREDRAMARDGVSREDVMVRIRCQKTDSWREERSDYVVRNDGRPLLPQLIYVLRDITGGAWGLEKYTETTT